MLMEWPGVTPEEYDRVVELLDLDASPAEGGQLHVAGFESDSLRVLDLWESQAHFERFLESRLMPAVQQAGIDRGEPIVRLYDAYNYFRNPGVEIPEVGATKIA